MSAEQRQERRLNRFSDRRNIDRGVGGALERHVMHPDAASLRCFGRSDTVSSLVDDSKSQVFQQRDALRQRQCRAARKQSQVCAGFRVTVTPVKIDRPRLVFGQKLDNRDVPGRFVDRERLAVGGRKRIAIASEQKPRPDAVMQRVQARAQSVAPGSHDGRDAAFQGFLVMHRRLTFVAADNEVGARQQSLGIGGIGRGHPTLIDRCQELADTATDGGVVTVLGDEHEDGHEPVEFVDPRQRPDPGAFGKIADFNGEFKQRLIVYLKHLVARIALQYGQQRAAHVTGGIQAGTRDDAGDFLAQIRDRAGHVGVEVRREQPDQPQLAFQLAGARKQLDPDIVKVDTPVHPRLHVGFGDDQRPWPSQESTDFRRHHDQFAAAPKYHDGGIAQQTEAGAGHRIRGDVAIGQPVFPNSQECEVIRADPIQKRDRLGDFLPRKRRRVHAIRLHRLVGPGAHRDPIRHRDRDIRVHFREAIDQFGAGAGIVDPAEMDVQKTFAGSRRLPWSRGFSHQAAQHSSLVTPDRQDRVCDEQRFIAALGKFGQR